LTFYIIQTYKRLQKLLLSLSCRATISSVDKLGTNHDAAVHGWNRGMDGWLSMDGERLWSMAWLEQRYGLAWLSIHAQL
jgi:hypothetical protein